VTCFVVPRVLADGTRNRLDVVRLKDKLGNRSNASSELELDGTLAQRLGDEGRGVRTIIEMVAATRLDCVLGSAALMRHALAEASWHVAHRSAFGGLLVDKPLMQNVVADLAVESEAATALAMRLAAAVDRADDPHEAALRRIALPLAKFWVCKRTPAMVAEALECLGGNGYVEDSGLPLMFRESPLNSIWEGSGNVNALDVLRAITREPLSVEAFRKELALAGGHGTVLDDAVARVDDLIAYAAEPGAQAGARHVVEHLAVTLQASLLARYAPTEVADAFVASRLGGQHGVTFGTLDAGLSTQHARTIIDRAFSE
jgi:putative acyl-CoA dehydrogenase